MHKLTYYSVAQAAVILRVSTSLVRRWCREGRLPEMAIGKLRVIPAVALRKFAKVPRKRGRKAS